MPLTKEQLRKYGKRIDKIFTIGNNARSLIDIAEEYFKKKSYLSSFVVLLNCLEFTCLSLFRSIVRDKTVEKKKIKSKYSAEKMLDKMIANYSLGRFTLGELICLIEKNNEGHIGDSILNELKKINKVRIKYIHLLAMKNYESITRLENAIKWEIRNKNIFDFAKNLYSLSLRIRRESDSKIPPPPITIKES